MRTTEGTFAAEDGLTLFERAWLPADPAKAVVVIVHGFAEHCGRYQYVAEALVRHGYAVEALDQRGHGRSGGDRATVRSFALFIRDLRRFIDRVRGRHPGTPLFVLGHSMGGTIVTLFAIIDQPAVQGIVLSGPAVIPRDTADRITGPLLGAVGRVFPNFALAALPADSVSHDPAVMADYDSDPLNYRGKMKAGLITAFLAARKHIDEGMDLIAAPLLIMHGTDDELANPDGSVELFNRARSSDKQLKLYDGLAHEILNEPEKDQVIRELITWLDKHVPDHALAR